MVLTGGGTGYNLTATAAGVQTQDALCTTITLNSQGAPRVTRGPHRMPRPAGAAEGRQEDSGVTGHVYFT
jgi:hypothetical protein